MAEVRDQMMVPTALPINAVIAIATAPHTVTRSRLCPADAGADDAARRRGTGGLQRPGGDHVADAELVASVCPERVVGEEEGSRAERTLWLRSARVIAAPAREEAGSRASRTLWLRSARVITAPAREEADSRASRTLAPNVRSG